MADFRMPSLGADMEEGTVTKWLVHPGDVVHRGDIVAVVDTDKADVEVEVFDDGVVEELLVAEGSKVAVGTALARIGAEPSAGAAKPPPKPEAKPAVAPKPAKVSKPAKKPKPRMRAQAKRPAARRAVKPISAREYISPLARRRARELGLDTSTITGTGPGGAITRTDVEHAAAPARVEWAPPAPAARAAEDRATKKADAMRAAIARAMTRSKREIPHYYLAHDIDFSRARRFLDERNATRAITERVLPAALLLKATAVAVRETPNLNGFWVDDAFQPSHSVHVGVAISLRTGGLVAPAIHDVDTRELDDIMTTLRDLVARARSYSLRASEMSDPTITVTNLGDQGVQVVHGVIYPPQVALVGFGSISERAWAVDGMVGAHPILTATLAADHRASDGAEGAHLLQLVNRLLQEPEHL